MTLGQVAIALLRVKWCSATVRSGRLSCDHVRLPSGRLSRIVRALTEADLRDVLPRIQLPTLPLYGEADRRSPIPVAEQLHARIPRAPLVVMPALGHLSNVEAPERFNAEVRRFLTRP